LRYCLLKKQIKYQLAKIMTEKKVTTMDELAVMINGGFQSNQEYMDKKFGELKQEIGGVDLRLAGVEKNLREEIRKVDKKLDVFIETYHEEKLPMRMEYMETILNLHKK